MPFCPLKRTTECQRVDWAKLAETMSGQRVVLAIAVAKEDFVVAFLLKEEVALRVKWKHPEETREWLFGVQQVAAASPLEAVLEPSGT